jgi:hypothetical protein
MKEIMIMAQTTKKTKIPLNIPAESDGVVESKTKSKKTKQDIDETISAIDIDTNVVKDAISPPSLPKKKAVKFKTQTETPTATPMYSDNSSKKLDIDALDNIAYAEALSQAFILSDHDLRKLLVTAELALASRNPEDIPWITMDLQAKTLLMLKAIDWKLWEMYNKFVR